MSTQCGVHSSSQTAATQFVFSDFMILVIAFQFY